MFKKILSLVMLVGSLQASVEIIPMSDKEVGVVQDKESYPSFEERHVILSNAFEKMTAAGIKVECSLKSWAKNTYCFNADSLDALVKNAYENARQRVAKKRNVGPVVIKNQDMKKAFKEVIKAYNITALRSSLTRAEKALLVTAGTIGGAVALSLLFVGMASILLIVSGGSLF